MLNKELTDQDYCDAAKDLRSEPEALMAVAGVESAGGGYDEQGRLKVRFEGHKFRSATGGRFDRSHPQLSYPYKYQKGKPHGYSAFNEAFELDEIAALESSSFGKFQPLSANYREAGFDDVREFVDFLRVSEKNQLIVFVKMVKFRHIDDELRRLDWAGFARNYNGASYRDNDYDGKMERAFHRYRKLKINCNPFNDLRDDEIEIDLPEAALPENEDRSIHLTESGSDAPKQVAENITNVNNGDKTVPDNFVPQDKTVDAPAPSGMMRRAKLWFAALGLGIPSASGIVESIKNLYADGTVNIREVFSVVGKVAVFVLPYAAYIAIAFIVFWAIKELLKQVTLMVKVYVTGRADMHNVEIAPVAKITKGIFYDRAGNQNSGSDPLGIN